MHAFLVVAAGILPPTVDIPSLGTIVGTTSDLYPGVDRFFNIPFAKPPRGELRWKSPVPHGPFSTTPLNGTMPGNVCVQPAIMFARLDPSDGWTRKYLDGLRMDEDCLTLNIATPARKTIAVESSPLPVMVWFHGGGYSVGSGANYRNDALVHASNHRVLVVTINYRLNIFGFLGSTELLAEATGATKPTRRGTGNYGLEDQRLALRWVQDHIHAFGGAPNAVTIFGESAGGNSVISHLVMPRSYLELDGGAEADPLYARAIIQSGTYAAAMPLRQAESIYRTVLASTGCADAACLRGRSTMAVAAAWPGPTGPVIDGVEMPGDPYVQLDAGRFNTNASVIIGHNREEMVMSLVRTHPSSFSEIDFEMAVRYVAPRLDASAMAQVKALYTGAVWAPYYPRRRGNQTLWWWAAAAAISDKEMGLGHCAVRRVARQLSRGGSPAVYMYLFAHPPIRDDTDGTYGWIFGPQFFEPGNMVSVALHPRHAKTGCGVGCRVCGMGERVRARHAQPSPLTR